MKITQRIIAAGNALLGRKSALPQSAAAQRWLAGDDASVGDELTHPYASMVWVYAAVRACAQAVAQVPLKFYDASGKELPPTHQVVKLFANVNPIASRYQLIEATVAYLKLSGECFWVFDAPANGIPSAIWTPDPQTFTVHLDASRREIGSYEQQQANGARPVTFDPDEVMHLKQFNPYNALRGLSDISALTMTLTGQLGAANYNAEFFSNGTVIGTLLKSDSLMSADQIRLLRDQFSERHAGRGKAHKPAVLPKGMDVVQGVSQKDVEFLQYMKLGREEICAAFGVPLAMLGVVEDVNRANGEVQERNFWKRTALPIMRAIEDKLATDFFARYAPGLRAAFDLSAVDVLAENLTGSIDNALKLWNMGIPLSEIDRRLNLGLDAAAITAAEENEAAEREAAEAAAQAAANVPAAAPAVPQDAGKAINKGIDKVAVWKRYVSAWQPVENAYRDKLRGYFFDLRKEVLRNLAKAAAKGVTRKSDPPAGINEALDEIVFDLSKARTRAAKISVPFFERAAGAGAGTLADYGWSFNWRSNERVAEFLKMKAQRITEIAATQDAMLRRGLTRVIEDAMANAAREGNIMTIADAIVESGKELESITRESFNFAGSRSVTIARTEVGSAVSYARYEGMAENGVEKVEWITAADEGVRETHTENEAAGAVKLGDPFPGNGLTMPNDPSGDVEEVINCRCTLVPAEGEINV